VPVAGCVTAPASSRVKPDFPHKTIQTQFDSKLQNIPMAHPAGDLEQVSKNARANYRATVDIQT